MKSPQRKSRAIWLMILTVSVIGLVAAGCGSDGDSGESKKASKTDSAMESKKDDAMKSETAMEAKKDDAMMESKDAMAKDEGAAMEKGKDAMVAKKDAMKGQLPLTEARSGLSVVASKSDFGQILFDNDGQVFYLFDADTTSKSTCYGACAEAWPPVLLEGAATAGAGADSKLVGTTTRKDGSTQLTYNGHPLYYYAHEKAGEVKCHNINDNGGLWLVVQPNGKAAA